MNIDEEIKKIIFESLNKAKNTSKTNIIINPFSDIKKKDLNKIQDNNQKLKLITKQSNTKQVVVKELDKKIFTTHDKDCSDEENI
jgi:hypothetical protein